MNFEWKTALLGDLCTMKNGYAFKGSDFTDHGVAVIKIKNVKPNRIIMDDLSYVPQEIADQRKKWLIQRGEILLTMTGNRADGSPESWVGKAAIFNESVPCLLNQRVSAIKAKDESEIDTAFLGYYLSSWETQLYFIKRANSSGGQANISPDIVMNMPVNYPTLANQKKIVSILSAIDSKIKVNNEINDNLQQQLFALYENTTLTTSCANETTLSALCDFQEGYVNPVQTHPEYFDGEVKWLRAVDINESFVTETSRTLTRAGFESAKKSALLFKPNTIAISKSGTIGRLGIIADYMCGNRAVINIAPHDTSMLAFIYCFLKSKQREFPNMAVGSVQKNLYVSLLEPLAIPMPDDESLTIFNAAGASLLNAIHNNCVENAKLASLRDTILPKLMSGEIDVSDIQL